ncbi:Methionine aminopeptidase [Candidatus Annandia adelgestsuga]|uniref:Methionine aminopeptidase n=1 Tax=Candidatus Annandia adelgestsuga TaxID=1302411 RepID=A0A3S9J7D8_9ENTR|nr:type I methionyl aminopeptidase [Candidatus Annandia adelgestsuga]AZP36169.1 Methionine aminopeptidase [Candidatus Annandia adelgestsuga]
MKITINNNEDINKMRIVCKKASQILEMIEYYIKPGITTEKIDYLCHNFIVNKTKSISACLGYQGFLKSICTSVNNVVCHGIPNNKKLKEGDIVNIDVTLYKNGFYGDTSKMFLIGNKYKKKIKKLCKETLKSLYISIKIIKPGIRLGLIGKTIQKYAEKKGFSVVRDYCGHGIGKNFHEDPIILHYEDYDNGIILKQGMIFTIEPMLNIGKFETYLDKDGWSVKTIDKKFSAQYEHTVLVTKNSYEILTLRKNENIDYIKI